MISNYKINYSLDYDPSTKAAGYKAKDCLRGKGTVDVEFTVSGKKLGKTLSFNQFYGGKTVIEYIRELILELRHETREHFNADDEYACIRLTYSLKRDYLYNPTFLVWVNFTKGGRKDGCKIT